MVPSLVDKQTGREVPPPVRRLRRRTVPARPPPPPLPLPRRCLAGGAGPCRRGGCARRVPHAERARRARARARMRPPAIDPESGEPGGRPRGGPDSESRRSSLWPAEPRAGRVARPGSRRLGLTHGPAVRRAGAAASAQRPVGHVRPLLPADGRRPRRAVPVPAAARGGGGWGRGGEQRATLTPVRVGAPPPARVSEPAESESGRPRRPPPQVPQSLRLAQAGAGRPAITVWPGPGPAGRRSRFGPGRRSRFPAGTRNSCSRSDDSDKSAAGG